MTDDQPVRNPTTNQRAYRRELSRDLAGLAYPAPAGVRFVAAPNRGARTWAQIKADEKRFRATLERIAVSSHADEMRSLARTALNV